MLLQSIASLLVALASLLVLPGVAAAQDRDEDTIVVITGGAAVAEGETVDGVYVVDGPVTIDGTVDGDVVVVGSDTEISGEVTGSVTVLAKRAVIASGARIGGDLRYGDEEPEIGVRRADRRRGEQGGLVGLSDGSLASALAPTLAHDHDLPRWR